MIKNTTIRIATPDYSLINSALAKNMGTASMRIMLRKTAVALKPHYAPLVQLAQSVYSSGFGRRSGALSQSFGAKVWSAKRGVPRAANIIGVNNKKGKARFRSWQQKARNAYTKTLGSRLKHPLPKRLTDPDFHVPSKILHLVDEPVKSHTVKPRLRRALAAPEKGVNAFWPKSKQAGGWSGRGIIRRIRKKGEAIAKRRHPVEFHRAFDAEVGKKLRAAYRRSEKRGVV